MHQFNSKFKKKICALGRPLHPPPKKKLYQNLKMREWEIFQSVFFDALPNLIFVVLEKLNKVVNSGLDDGVELQLHLPHNPYVRKHVREPER